MRKISVVFQQTVVFVAANCGCCCYLFQTVDIMQNFQQDKSAIMCSFHHTIYGHQLISVLGMRGWT